MYKDLEGKKNILLNYIKRNPNATYNQIRKDIKIKVERVFPGMMKEAWKAAGVPFSKALSKRSRDEQIKDVISFIKENPGCNVTEIQKATKVTIPRVFGSIINAYGVAGVDYPKLNKLNKALRYLKENPLSSSVEIQEIIGIGIYNYFKNMEEFCKKANVKYIEGHKKRSIKIQNKIIDYIKSNSDCTQWEINKACKTHVQEIFKGGIREAYEKACIKYPEERRKNYGAMNKDVKLRALKFENEIIKLLYNFGNVKRYPKTKVGIADALIRIGNKKYVVEIKDYQSKPISLSDVKQVNKYIENVSNCSSGLLICNTKGKKDKFYISKNEILVITKEDILNGDIAQPGRVADSPKEKPRLQTG